MKQYILTTDKPNANGRIYPRAAIEEMITKMEHPVMAVLGVGKETVSLSELAAAVSNFRLEDDNLVGDATILKTPAGDVLEKMGESVAFSPVGKGDVGEDGVVSNYTLSYIAIVPKDQAA